MAKSMSTSVSDISSKNSAKRKKIVIEHVDLDKLNLIVDGEITAIAPVDINLLAIGTSDISGYKIYVIDLKKLDVDLVF